MEKKTKSFVTGALILGVAGVIVKVIGAFFRIPLANSIGSIGMSYYEVAYPYYSWLLVISTAGFPTAISKLVAESVTLGDYRGARNIFIKALKILLIIGIVTALLMFLFADSLAALSTFNKASLSFKALAPALFFVSLMCAFRGYLQGMQMMTGTAVSQVVEQVGKLAIGLTLAIKMLPQGPEYAAMGALIGVTASEALALGVIAIFYFRKKKHFAKLMRRPCKVKRHGSITKSLLAIAIPITIGASISPLTGIVDSALIGRILQDLGFSEVQAQTAYSLLRTNVTTLVNMPGVLTMALAMSLVPAIASNMAEKNYNSVRLTCRMGMKLALIIGLPCAVGLFVLGKPLLAMLYSGLTETELTLAADLMYTASIGVIFLSLVQSMTGAIQGMGRPNVPVFNLFIGFVLKVITQLVLMNMPDINIQGAAVSTVVCYAYAGIMDMIYVVRRTGMRFNTFDTLLKPLISSLIMGGAVYGVYTLMPKTTHETLVTIAAVGVGLIVYVMLFFVLKMFNEKELSLIPGGGLIKRLMYRKRG